MKSYLIYIRYDEKYSSYRAWSSLSYTFHDISRPNTPMVDNFLPVLIFFTCILFIGYLYCLATVNQRRGSPSINSALFYDILPEQRWLIYYLLAVILFQNPIYCIVSRLENPSAASVYACYVLDALSEATLITIWLLFADGLSRQMGNIWTFYIPKILVGTFMFMVNVVVITLQFPSINLHDHRSPVEVFRRISLSHSTLGGVELVRKDKDGVCNLFNNFTFNDVVLDFVVVLFDLLHRISTAEAPIHDHEISTTFISFFFFTSNSCNIILYY